MSDGRVGLCWLQVSCSRLAVPVILAIIAPATTDYCYCNTIMVSMHAVNFTCKLIRLRQLGVSGKALHCLDLLWYDMLEREINHVTRNQVEISTQSIVLILVNPNNYSFLFNNFSKKPRWRNNSTKAHNRIKLEKPPSQWNSFCLTDITKT